MTRPRLYLAKKDFENTINQVAHHLSYLQLFFQGEPFLHPKIFEYIVFAKERNVYTSISTNGQFLSEINCNKIVNSGLHRLIISLDGITQEVYEKYRVGGSMALVLSGLNNLLEAKKKLKSYTPYVILQFVVFSTNEHQIEGVKNLAKTLRVDKLQIKTAQIDNFRKGNVLIPTNKKYSRYIEKESGMFALKRKANFKCWRVWNGSVLSAENQLLPCCFDKNAAYAYNSEESTSLQTNWKGDKARLFRKRVWSKDSEIEMCKNCTEGLK
jgi:MoaA/NifB/PqqE/SkfB family radical SAM enzyme